MLYQDELHSIKDSLESGVSEALIRERVISDYFRDYGKGKEPEEFYCEAEAVAEWGIKEAKKLINKTE